MVGDASLALRLRKVSALTFMALAGSGFGRCDLRMDAAGDIYLLEINPNCAVFYPDGQHGSADLILANDPRGHRDFLEHLLRCALRRRDRANRPWALRFAPGRGFGMFAIRDIRPGTVVERYEARSHVLVSRSFVERQWKGLRREWFQRYAWPLSPDVHVTWSDNPDEWRPINHGCDPNTWLEGLDLVARRHITTGEELTVDYATFLRSADVAIRLRTAGRRTAVRSSPAATTCCPDVRARYGNHVSDFVREVWRHPERHESYGAGGKLEWT
jgi:D-alanine-D-alanine ligase